MSVKGIFSLRFSKQIFARFCKSVAGLAIQAKPGEFGAEGPAARRTKLKMEAAAPPIQRRAHRRTGPSIWRIETARATKRSYLAGGACAKMCATRNSGGTQTDRSTGISENCGANPGAPTRDGWAECS